MSCGSKEQQGGNKASGRCARLATGSSAGLAGASSAHLYADVLLPSPVICPQVLLIVNEPNNT